MTEILSRGTWGNYFSLDQSLDIVVRMLLPVDGAGGGHPRSHQHLPPQPGIYSVKLVL